MPYSRKRLINEVGSGLSRLGYQRVPGSSDLAAALVYRWIDEDLALTLGLEFSTRYQDRFTGSFYLAPSFHWSYVLADYPMRAYERIGKFLTAEERRKLLDPAFAEPGMIDAWWIGFDEDSVESFLEAVTLTEPRFLSQDNLREEILSSREMAEHRHLVQATQRRAADLGAEPGGLSRQPRRYQPPVPPPFYWAAEQVLTERLPDLVTRDFVKLLAEDAWRLANLRPVPEPEG